MAPIFDIIILAGGRGSRIGGQDKGLISYQNKPLIEHIYHTAKELAKVYHSTIYISCNRNISFYQQYGTTITDNYANYCGPLAGIASVLSLINSKQSGSYVLVLPVDTPHLTTTYLHSMITTLPQRPTYDIAVGCEQTFIHPTILFLKTSLLSSLKRSLKSQQYQAYTWVTSHKYIAVPSTDSAVFTNINTLKQL